MRLTLIESQHDYVKTIVHRIIMKVLDVKLVQAVS